ncbi:MAG TPA: bifunctional DNA-formamidopyrimidine glycosylase/DNA-(apurinic or apyrimidinic site) lyase [Solirubrobacteraceae bacterium]|jgi:formamidopyrimidine-DNA glycosylase
MPELPEVETIRRQLAPVVEGRRLKRVEVLDQRWCMPLLPEELTDAVEGRRVQELQRRGKYLLWRLDGEVTLVQHLRMSGAVLCDPPPETRHVRVRIELSRRRGASGPEACTRLAVTDPRRFGTAQLLFGHEALEEFFAERLGLEPFHPDFTTEHLWQMTRGRTAPIKAFLLDQRRIAGVGNIYADEALFAAKLHPLMPAGRLTRAQAAALREAVIEALQAGIDAKGASIEDFRHVDGVTGSFQDRFKVHLREGEPCVVCGSEIVKMVVGGRGTYVCEHCQRRPRARRPSARRAR